MAPFRKLTFAVWNVLVNDLQYLYSNLDRMVIVSLFVSILLSRQTHGNVVLQEIQESLTQAS